jgi:protoporphyrinogen oxidase
MKIKTLIIGAGPTGLGAAYKLNEINENDFVILEKTNCPGGLSSTFTDEKGFLWDIGGHVQFSHYEYFDKAMLNALGKDGWLHHERESWVWMRNRFIPYPFQNNIHRLPEKEMLDCLDGLENRDSNLKLNNFEDWIQANFGKGISKHFLIPYNYKVWAHYPKDMNNEWMGERVSTIDLDRIKENIKLNRDDVSWGPNNTFQFPLKGGTGAIWKAIANRVGKEKIITDCEVIKIDTGKKIAYDKKGNEYHYQNILSTIPLKSLVDITANISKAIKEKAHKLKHSNTNIVGIGIEGELPKHLEKKCWMYYPEDDCPFYRVTVFSNYSPNNVPDRKKHISFMTETSESEFKPVNQEKLVQQTIEGLRNTNMITDEHKIISTWKFRAPFGYPVPSNERDNILKEVIPYLDNLKLYSRGRFGSWKYEVSNQDHSFMQGAEWVSKIYEGKNEETLVI